MFMEERHREIAGAIEKEGKITIAQIAEKYGISDESARRDLRLLEQRGLCKRTHGGAIRLQPVGQHYSHYREFDNMPIFPTYREIAKAAAALIKQNDVVYLTGGSFGHIILPYLPREFRYTLVVNSVDLAKALKPMENIDVFIAGGKMRPSGSVADSLARDFLSRIHFDLCLLTGAGLTAEFGLSNGTGETAAYQQTILKNSRRKYLLLPGSKIGTDSFIKVCDAEEFDGVITDWECLEEQIAALEDKGVAVTVVEEAP